MLGLNYSRLNQPEQANPYLEKFIAGPQNETTTPWLPLSYYMLANNNYLILDKQIARIKEDKTGDALAKFDLIAVAAKANTGIQPNLVKTIELKPDIEDAFVKLGNYYFFCQDFDNALKTYNDLIAKFPTSPDLASYKSFMQNIEKERDALKALKTKKKTKIKRFSAQPFLRRLEADEFAVALPGDHFFDDHVQKKFPRLGVRVRHIDHNAFSGRERRAAFDEFTRQGEPFQLDIVAIDIDRDRKRAADIIAALFHHDVSQRNFDAHPGAPARALKRK